MRGLIDCLDVPARGCTALVGSGGKTTLLWYLAGGFPGKSVLVSTTTKIGMPPSERFDRFLDGDALLAQPPEVGVTLAAERPDGRKLAALSPEVLAWAAENYDVTLLECDGAHARPLKGWAEYEPVVPAFTALTVGVIPVWPVGRPATEELVHRLPLFSQLTGIEPGETIRPAHLAAAIGGQGEKCLFTSAVGRRVLFFSQVEDEEALALAREVTAQLPAKELNTLDRIVAGSVHRDAGTLLQS